MSNRPMKKNRLNQALQCFISLSSSSVLLYSSQLQAETTQVQQLQTIVVEASKYADNYGEKTVNISGYANPEIAKVPASVSVIGADLIADQQARVLSDIVKNDAAVGDNYAPLGFYPNIVTRGFVLDQASSYLINSMLIRGEQNVALENKQQVEILKGISAMQSGMSTAGGVINYVTKRPEQVRNLSMAVDEYGDNLVAVDVGGFWGQQQQFGYRINLANQNTRPYVEHSNGERQFGALALDWKIDDKSKLEFDIESQRQQQRSVPGYELLDGNVPTGVKWDRLLGYQSDAKPVTNKSLNSSLQYQYQFNDSWSGRLSAAHSKVVIDDFSSFAYGCFSDICDFTGTGSGFDKNGNYDIYNWRNPDDTFQTNQYKATLNGAFNTGPFKHDLYLELTQTQKKHSQYPGVNQLIGTGNIYNDEVHYIDGLELTTEITGDKYQSLRSSQTALTVLDQIAWNSQWSSIVGGKWVDLNEKAYSAAGVQSRKTDLNKFLPQLALMFTPWENTNLYASYSKGLTDGGAAPWYAKNFGETLAPINSRQYEIGIKQQINDYLFTAALFDIKKDNQSIEPNAAGEQIFMDQGQQHNYGLELGVSGRINEALKISSSMAYTYAKLIDISNPDYQGHQLQNVPKLRFSSYAAYDIAAIEGLSVLGGLRYSSSKFANKEGTAKVAGYSVVDLGAAYRFDLNRYATTVRFNLDNVFNKKYWRDAGGFIGDDYLFLGAPRTAKLALDINF